ncbi:MAG: division/cell wall cluster transcriptional repressor MraZ [Acidimicrobiales bacterium]
MVPRFFGRYEHSLDVKGRIILPARFRANFDTLAYLSQHTERCLALWTPEKFEKQVAEMEAMQGRGPRERNMVRVWASGVTEVELDRQGRVAIPLFLREYARLDSAVLIRGALDRIELWNPAQWEARIQPAEANFTDPEPTGSELTGSELTGSELTGSELTGSEPTGSEPTGSVSPGEA